MSSCSALPTSCGPGRRTGARQNAEVVLNSVTEIGLDQILAGREAWLRVSREFIADEMELLLPVGSVLEISKDEPVDYELMAAVTALKRRGGRLALDGFRFSPEDELLLRLADVVKLDLVDLGPEQFHEEIAHARMYGAKVLANRVENKHDHASVSTRAAICSRAISSAVPT